MTSSPASPTRDFTPAVPFLGLYDFIVATLTRETLWRGALLRQVQPRQDDVIADLGCGTASFLSLLGRAVMPAKLIGIDPDVAILAMAERKLGCAVVMRGEAVVGVFTTSYALYLLAALLAGK